MRFCLIVIALIVMPSGAFVPTTTVVPSLLDYYAPTSRVTSTTSSISRLSMFGDDRGTRVIAKAPILKSWRRNQDGSITGKISNSPEFRNNEEVTTSRIVERIIRGDQTVTSVSGSKFRLQGKMSPLPKNPDPKQIKGTFALGKKSSKKVSRTFSVKNAKVGPRGMAVLRKWKQNRDGTISGKIFSSKGFNENQFVTTSVTKGIPEANSVATTISGSKYYLEGNGKVLKRPPKSSGTRSVAKKLGYENDNGAATIATVAVLAAAAVLGFNSAQAPNYSVLVESSASRSAVTADKIAPGKITNSVTPLMPIFNKPNSVKIDGLKAREEQQNKSVEKEQEAAKQVEKRISADNEKKIVSARTEEERVRVESQKKEVARIRVEEERVRIEKERDATRIRVEEERVRIEKEKDAARIREEEERVRIEKERDAARIRVEEERIQNKEDAARIREEEERTRVEKAIKLQGKEEDRIRDDKIKEEEARLLDEERYRTEKEQERASIIAGEQSRINVENFKFAENIKISSLQNAIVTTTETISQLNIDISNKDAALGIGVAVTLTGLVAAVVEAASEDDYYPLPPSISPENPTEQVISGDKKATESAPKTAPPKIVQSSTPNTAAGMSSTNRLSEGPALENSTPKPSPVIFTKESQPSFAEKLPGNSPELSATSDSFTSTMSSSSTIETTTTTSTTSTYSGNVVPSSTTSTARNSISLRQTVTSPNNPTDAGAIMGKAVESQLEKSCESDVITYCENLAEKMTEKLNP